MTLAMFASVLYPFLITFLTGRLVLQTDLVMVARLGQTATAAFAIPLRIMVLDMIAAFSFAPVVSVMISSADNESDRARAIGRSMTVALFSGIILMFAGLALYPRLVTLVSPDAAVTNMATAAVLWLTLAIPARLMQFVGAMALHGCGRGKKLIPLSFFGLALNGLLDYMLIFFFKLGFRGAYLGTFLCSHVSLAWTLALLWRPSNGCLFLRLGENEWMSFFARTIPEMGRLTSERLQALVVLWVFSRGAGVAALSAFAVAMEFSSLLFMPAIAIMRATAVLLSPSAEKSFADLWADIQPVIIFCVTCSFFVGGAVMLSWRMLGVRVYNLSAAAMSWWHPLAMLMLIWFPLRVVDSFLRGIWQAKSQLGKLFGVDAVVQWALALPMIYFAIHFGSPLEVWLAFLAADAVTALLVFRLETDSRFSFLSANRD